MRGFVAVVSSVFLLSCGDSECPPGTVLRGSHCVSTGDADSDSDDCAGTPYYRDADGDGFGGDTDTVCTATDGYVDAPGDCDDDDEAVHPGVEDVCNGLDDDCEAGPDTGHPCVAGATAECNLKCGTGSISCSDTCVPSDCLPPAESCNERDDDCDGMVDEGIYALGAPIQVSATSADDYSPDVAWMGASFFVVWANGGGTYEAMHAARIVDDAPEPDVDQEVPPAPVSNLFRPRVAQMGDDFVLAFTGASGGPASAGFVLGCVIDPLAPSATGCTLFDEFAAPPWVSTQYTSGLAASADAALVAFVNDVTQPLPAETSIGIFDATPEVVAGPAVVGPATRTGSSSAAWDEVGGVFAVAWASDSDVWVARVDASGVPVGSASAVATHDGVGSLYGPAIGWGDGGGLVAYVREGVATNLEVQALDADAAPVGDPVVVGPSGPNPLIDRPIDVEWTEGAWVVSYYDSAAFAVALTRLKPDGGTMDPPIFVSPEGAAVQNSAVAWSGDEVGIAWVDDSGADGDSDVWFARYSCR